MEELVYQGSEVKALGDGRVAGWLVRYSTASDPDLAGDFFTADTDFLVSDGAKTAVYFSHGLDKTLGKKTLGIEDGTLHMKDAGVWLEMQLDLRDGYESAIYTLAQKGKLGMSSGTAPHLVEREQKGASAWIKRWPLGLDASLTPTPCEPRTTALPLKSLEPEQLADLTDLSAKSAHGLTLAEHSDRTLGAVQEFTERLESYRDTKAADDRPLSATAKESVKALVDRLNAVLAYRSPSEIKAAQAVELMRIEAEHNRTLYGNPQ